MFGNSPESSLIVIIKRRRQSRKTGGKVNTNHVDTNNLKRRLYKNWRNDDYNNSRKSKDIHLIDYRIYIHGSRHCHFSSCGIAQICHQTPSQTVAEETFQKKVFRGQASFHQQWHKGKWIHSLCPSWTHQDKPVEYVTLQCNGIYGK